MTGIGIAPAVTDAAIIAAAYLGVVVTSGSVVTRTLSWADAEYADTVTDTDRDIGVVVGKTENVLLLTLVLVGAYTAIAVIFAAKSIIRSDDMKNNSLFYLAGTLVNVTYSVMVGIVVRILVGASGTAPVF
ncbi:hypothetical protein QA600_15015 [Natronococcus sp. A-GB1]|uniref:hypothetical protein n=1 Tax=Natronococcus sp. A-GB1 TaxID=3037648 RepID=UPI00241D24A2|nr:hypothetical protein [Natronococcus sp. A-GB1]MDG5760645.1 hypothetical protein [Natronococcus sp. A-GB1]